MTLDIDTKPKRRLSAALMTGLAVSALLLLGTTVGTARADDRDHRGWEHNEGRDNHGHWTGGYYRAPPVVYGGGYYHQQPGYYQPGYYPPPVVYGPAIGLSLPGINLNIR